jgi:hypothetical protein
MVQTSIQSETRRPGLLTRRRFLVLSSGLATAGVISACGGSSLSDGPQREPPPLVDEAGFLVLSAIVTGVPQAELDRAAARAYRTALRIPDAGTASLAKLYTELRIGEAKQLHADDLGRPEGRLSPAGRETARTVANYWYRGQVPIRSAGRPPRSVTYENALGWQALAFTSPPGVCGEFGAWAFEPAA